MLSGLLTFYLREVERKCRLTINLPSQRDGQRRGGIAEFIISPQLEWQYHMQSLL